VFLDLINDSSDEDINTFLIVVLVLLTVLKLSVVEVLELVLLEVDELVEEFEPVDTVVPCNLCTSS
jgi:hypothetical protein